MKSINYIVYVLLMSSCIHSKNHIDNSELKIITVESKMAEFPGGTMEMYKFINSNIIYPIEAKENKWEGKVFFKWTIDTLGKVSNLEMTKTSGYKILDDEALRVMRLMPLWSPTVIENKLVSQDFNYFPIQFKLD